ncbi:MAG: ABC transporter permease subunit [Anaerolineae bacterium]|nr:ABC transporter permease subunit [Anaerolineae bacterium]
MTIVYIAWLTLREAGRRRILWLLGALSVAFLVLFAIGFRLIYAEVLAQLPDSGLDGEAASFFTIAGLYAVNFIIIMVSVLSTVDTVSGEIASHSVHSVVAKPIRRREVILGKWLAFALLVVTAVALLGGGVILICWISSGYLIPNAVTGLALIALEGIILASLTLLGGTRLSTLANGIAVFMLFGLSFLGGWTEQIGGYVGNQSAIRVGIVTSLLLPTEALWKRAAYLMQPPLFQQFASTPFAVTSIPSPAMVWYALLYCTVTVVLAVRAFGSRDL